MKVTYHISLIFISLIIHQSNGQKRDNLDAPIPKNIDNYFGWNIFRNSILSKQDSENFILSPVSIQLVISCLEDASEGNTKEQIKRITNNASSLQYYYILNPVRENPEIRSAVGIFVDSNDRVSEDVALRIFVNGGDVYNYPLKNDPLYATNQINAWASNRTFGQIPAFLGEDVQISDLKALLVSVVYFHGKWKNPFRSSAQRYFYTSPQNRVSSDFLEVQGYFKTGEISLVENISGTMISLPYKNNTYSMLIVMPNRGISLKTFVNNLEHFTFTDMISSVNMLKFSAVKLLMPKFTISSKISLKDPLKTMGLTDIFSSSKSKITKLLDSKEPLLISDMIQQATFEVNENGTTATAVTTAFVVPLSAAETEFTLLEINRPFLAIIVETVSQTPIFITRVMNPRRS